MSVLFVGRRSELDSLASLVRRARLDRAPIAALITGEPGSGKSSLLGELLREVTPSRKADGCYMTTGGVPPGRDLGHAAIR